MASLKVTPASAPHAKGGRIAVKAKIVPQKTVKLSAKNLVKAKAAGKAAQKTRASTAPVAKVVAKKAAPAE